MVAEAHVASGARIPTGRFPRSRTGGVPVHLVERLWHGLLQSWPPSIKSTAIFACPTSLGAADLH